MDTHKWIHRDGYTRMETHEWIHTDGYTRMNIHPDEHTLKGHAHGGTYTWRIIHTMRHTHGADILH